MWSITPSSPTPTLAEPLPAEEISSQVPVRLCALATVVPPHRVDQSWAREFARRQFEPALPDLGRYLRVFENAQVSTRYSVVPQEWWSREHSFGECNDLYIEWACKLGEEAIQKCLKEAGVSPEEVDHLFYVSTTGLAAPSIDAHLAHRLKLNRRIKRTPIWGLGCAGGIAGLARAQEWAQAFPGKYVLLVCVELCSITFQFKDFSKRNLVASSLFGDGGCALLLRGGSSGKNGASGPTIVGAQSGLWPDSLRVMGWDVVDTGFKVVFSSEIPSLVREAIRKESVEFLACHGLGLEDIRHFVFHPGGVKVLKAYEESLGLGPSSLEASWSVLRDYGNLSSCTVFFVLERHLKENRTQPGEWGLLAALGPGFSCELALFRL